MNTNTNDTSLAVDSTNYEHTNARNLLNEIFGVGRYQLVAERVHRPLDVDLARICAYFQSMNEQQYCQDQYTLERIKQKHHDDRAAQTPSGCDGRSRCGPRPRTAVRPSGTRSCARSDVNVLVRTYIVIEFEWFVP